MSLEGINSFSFDLAMSVPIPGSIDPVIDPVIPEAFVEPVVPEAPVEVNPQAAELTAEATASFAENVFDFFATQLPEGYVYEPYVDIDPVLPEAPVVLPEAPVVVDPQAAELTAEGAASFAENVFGVFDHFLQSAAAMDLADKVFSFFATQLSEGYVYEPYVDIESLREEHGGRDPYGENLASFNKMLIKINGATSSVFTWIADTVNTYVGEPIFSVLRILAEKGSTLRNNPVNPLTQVNNTVNPLTQVVKTPNGYANSVTGQPCGSQPIHSSAPAAPQQIGASGVNNIRPSTPTYTEPKTFLVPQRTETGQLYFISPTNGQIIGAKR